MPLGNPRDHEIAGIELMTSLARRRGLLIKNLTRMDVP